MTGSSLESTMEALWEQLAAYPARPEYVQVHPGVYEALSAVESERKLLETYCSPAGLAIMFPGLRK
jgi:hypothetical protein